MLRFSMRILWAMGGLLLVGLTSLMILINFLDLNKYQGILLKKIKQTTGREFAIDGQLDLKLLPNLQIIAHKVRILNPDGLPKGNLLQIDNFKIAIAMLPLLKRTLQVERVFVDGVNLTLLKTSDANNWSFRNALTYQKSEGSSFDFIFKQVEINNIHISYHDLNKNKAQIKFAPFNLSLNKPTGQVEITEDKITFKKNMLQLGKSFKTNFDLALNLNPPYSYQGNLAANHIPLNYLTSFLSNPLPARLQNTVPVADLQLKSQLSGNESNLKFKNLDLQLAKTRIRGELVFKLAPLQIEHALTIENLIMTDFIKMNGFQVKAKSITSQGLLKISKDQPKKITGNEYLNVNNIMLYGFKLNNLLKSLNQALDEIGFLKSLFTRPAINAALKQIQHVLDKLNGERKVNPSDTTDLGNLKVVMTMSNGNLAFNHCTLHSFEVDGLCHGQINLPKQTLNILIQARALAQDESSIINYIYFPYYVRGGFNNPQQGLDWTYIFQQFSRLYKQNNHKFKRN